MPYKFRFIFTILGIASVLTAITTSVSLAQDKKLSLQQLTPQQKVLVEAKEKARKEAGKSLIVNQEDTFVQAGQPSRFSSEKIKITKSEMLDRLKKAEKADKAYLVQLEKNYPDIAKQKRAAYESEKSRIESLPDNYVSDINGEGVEVGKHSINFSRRTYDVYTAKDPVNMIFYNVGSAWDVNYDLKNWVTKPWRDTSCNTTQWLYVWDASHTGGWNGWSQNQYPMEPQNTSWVCGSARDHLRLFQGLVRDSDNPGFGVWSATAVHHDNTGHTCTDDWEGPEKRLADTFRYNTNTSFVGAIWQADLGNAGKFDCATNDGKATFIELLR